MDNKSKEKLDATVAIKNVEKSIADLKKIGFKDLSKNDRLAIDKQLEELIEQFKLLRT